MRFRVTGVTVFMVLLAAFEGSAVGETLIGMHTTTADLKRMEAWEKWTGEPVPIVGENLFATTWDDFTGRYPEYGIGFTLEKWEAASRKRELPELDFALPMFPDRARHGAPDYRELPERWQDAAAGKFDRHFRALAETLVDKGFGKCRLRLGWEFNLLSGINRWSIRDQPENWPLFVDYWRRIHQAMMEVEGAEFRWVWSVILGEDQGDFLATRDAWPGDDFVDVVAVDIYDASGNYYWQQYEMEEPEVDWQTLRQWNWDYLARGVERDPYSGEVKRSGLPSLDSFRAFARDREIDFAITEWGVVQGKSFPSSDHWGGNDNPDFIEKMHSWIAENDVAYALYFENFMAHPEYGDVDHSLLPGYWNLPETSPDFVHPVECAHPRSAARYLALFHGQNEPARFSWAEPVLSFAEAFDELPGETWSMGTDWQWKRDALHVADPAGTTEATAIYPASGHDLISVEVAIPAGGDQGVDLVAGPYRIGLVTDEVGYLVAVNLRRRENGKLENLMEARPEKRFMIGRMLIPVSIEIKRLAGRGDMAVVVVKVSDEVVINFLDIGLPRQTASEIGVSAEPGAEVFVDDFEVRPLVP